MKNSTLRTLSAGAAITAIGAFALSATPAFATGHNLQISSFTSENWLEYDTNSDLGDDRGGIALTVNGVFDQGDSDNGMYHYDLTNYTESDLTRDNGDAVFTDLGTKNSYFFNWTYTEDANSGTTEITGFTNITDDGNVGTDTVTLENPIELYMTDVVNSIDYQEDYVLLNGNGIVGIWDLTEGSLAVIDIATGTITSVETNTNDEFAAADSQIVPKAGNGETANTFDAWGVLEFDGTDYSYFGPGYNNDSDVDDEVIARFPLTQAVPATIETFATDLVGDDLWRFVPDCENGRWYGHIEGSGENLVAGDVSCTYDSAGAAEALAETGFNATAALGFVAASVAAGGLLVLRRRARI